MNQPDGVFFAIILAAGDSRRMGQEKPSLPWLDGLTLLEWTVKSLIRTGWLPCVVLGPHNYPGWLDRLPGALMVQTNDLLRRKTVSIAAGAAAAPAAARHILITSVDLPRPQELYRLLKNCAQERSDSVIAPKRQYRCGHPVILKAELKDRLLSLDEESLGLRGLLESHAASTFLLPVEPEWLHWNLNTPAVYEEALNWFILNN